jgi:ribosomal protein L37AE/L43A
LNAAGEYRGVSSYLPIPVGLVAFYVIFGLARYFKTRMRRPNHPRCGNCDYDLSVQLSQEHKSVWKCPECGEPYDFGNVVPAGFARPTSTNRGIILSFLVIFSFVAVLSHFSRSHDAMANASLATILLAMWIWFFLSHRT